MTGDPPKLRARSAGLTDVGRQRKHNEDHVLTKDELGFWVVADGMGGHNAGDVASRLTTTSLKNFFEATAKEPIPDDLLQDEDMPSGPGAARRLVAGIKKANRDVYVISSTHQQHHGMGSTVVAMHLDPYGTLHVAHVGDSRCYRLRDGRIEQLTRDHSLINDAIDMKPDLTEDEIARLPKNIITRALGMREEVKVDYRALPVQAGDGYLLCSDGLSGMVSDPQILEIVSLAGEPAEACELLIAEANDAGGTDNISAVLIAIDEVDADAAGEDVAQEPVEAADEAGIEADGRVEADGEQTEVEAPENSEPTEPTAAPEIGDEATDPRSRSAGASPFETGVDEAVRPSLRELLERGAEVDIELAGPWSSEAPVLHRRCPSCSHELYPGNTFCVECGARVEEG
jgi:protein phosphatase